MRTAALSIIAVALYAFLWAPIVVVIIYSFNAARFGAGWEGWTIKWYLELASNATALQAAKNTLLLGVLSTAISSVIGTGLGYGLGRFRFWGDGFVSRALHVPVFIPDIVLAVSLLLFYSLVRTWFGILELGLTTMVIAHVTFQIPFIAIIVRARLAGLDPALHEAAQDLGANEWQTFLHVYVPLMRPGILAGAILAFTLSLDDFVVSFFTSGPGSTTLPILIYSSVKRGITPDINALSTMIVVISAAATLLIMRFRRKASEGP